MFIHPGKKKKDKQARAKIYSPAVDTLWYAGLTLKPSFSDFFVCCYFEAGICLGALSWLLRLRIPLPQPSESMGRTTT